MPAPLVWKRLARDRWGRLGLAIVAALVVLAIAAPLVSRKINMFAGEEVNRRIAELYKVPSDVLQRAQAINRD